jgi:hypothetical protein
MKAKLLALLLLVASAAPSQAALLTENFDNVAGLAGSGWTLLNNSANPGIGWFQGNSGVFPAYDGAPNSYIAANFLAANSGAIDLWLITPILDLSSALNLTFVTRRNDSPFFDTLDVRLSANGASLNLADFATSLALSQLLDGADYPIDWTPVSSSVAGQGAGATGRLAFRYTVADITIAGDYIGIDSVYVVPEPPSFALLLAALLALGLRTPRYRRPTA